MLTRTDLLIIVPYQEKGAFGVQLIESYLKQRGHRVKIIFFKERSPDNTLPSSKEIEILLDCIKTSAPLLIGFSVMSVFYRISEMLTGKIKEQFDIPIIWGGVHATICPEDCITVADICCIGEGDEPLHQLLISLKQEDKNFNEIPNCWIKKDGQIVKNPMSYMCADLDSLPFPIWNHKDKYFIENDQILNESPSITYIKEKKKYYFKAFRGCPFSCTYCGNKVMMDAHANVGKYARKRSAQSVLDELKAVVKQFPDLKQISSYDEAFLVDKKNIAEFAERYKKEIELPFSCNAIITLLSKVNIVKMTEAGLTDIVVGVEAFSEQVRKDVYNRKMSNDKIIDKARLLEKYKIGITYEFILDNPLESHKDLAKCFWKLINKLPRPCSFNYYSLSHLPKTALTERFLSEGIIQQKDVIGKSDKAFMQWKASSNYLRDKKIMFWMNLYRMYGTQFRLMNRSFVIPRWMITSIAFLKCYWLTPGLLKKIFSTMNRFTGLKLKT